MTLINDSVVIVKGKKYRAERWQGYSPYYVFHCLEEEYQEPIEKPLKEVEYLIKTGIIQMI